MISDDVNDPFDMGDAPEIGVDFGDDDHTVYFRLSIAEDGTETLNKVTAEDFQALFPQNEAAAERAMNLCGLELPE